MIKIESQNKGMPLWCANCKSEYDVKLISLQNSEIDRNIIPLCRDCRKNLMELLMCDLESDNNMERGNYMSIDRVKRFSGIVNIPPEQIKCREPKPPVRPSCVTKHKNPAGFTPKPVPEVKQAVNELVEPVNKAFPQDNSQPTDTTNKQFPQDSEENEYRYLNAAWLDEIATGLTAGIKKHPGETWHDIPVNEHLARAFRHINLMRIGDRSDNHIINASMRLMMAYVVDRNK